MSNSQADRLAEQIKGMVENKIGPVSGLGAHDLIDALAALAKQQASPDAQPVAWQMRTRLGGREWSRWAECADMPLDEPREQSTGPLEMQFRPVYAHPPSAPQCEQAALPAVSEPPRALPETMDRDEMLKYYSSYANLCAHEALQYKKQIRELKAALAQGTTPAAGVGEQATGGEAERAVLYVVRAKRDGKNFIKGELFLNEVTETAFEVSEPDDFECLPLYEHPARAILAEAGIKEKTNG